MPLMATLTGGNLRDSPAHASLGGAPEHQVPGVRVEGPLAGLVGQSLTDLLWGLTNLR